MSVCEYICVFFSSCLECLLDRTDRAFSFMYSRIPPFLISLSLLRCCTLCAKEANPFLIHQSFCSFVERLHELMYGVANALVCCSIVTWCRPLPKRVCIVCVCVCVFVCLCVVCMCVSLFLPLRMCACIPATASWWAYKTSSECGQVDI